MATTTATIAASNSSDAHFRAWVQFIFDVFTNGGWVQTADTGQINPATATAPAGGSEKTGYAIFRMADSLQATHPVYLKLTFGSSNLSKDHPGVWFSVGIGTDGAGNLVDADGLPFRVHWQDWQTQPPIGLNTHTVISRHCIGSATTSRAIFALWEAQPVWTGATKTTPDHNGAEANHALVFSIERAKDWDGADVGEYVSLMWSAGAGGGGANGGADQTALVRRNIYAAIDGSEPSNLMAELTGLGYGIAVGEPSLGYRATPPVPFQNGTLGMPPGINLMLSRSDLQQHDAFGNYTTGTTVEVSSYGVAHTYRVFAGMRGGSEAAQDSGAHVWILFE